MTNQPQTNTSEELLTVPEVATLLRLSTTSVYRLVERRVIPFHRLPRGLRFNKKDVAAYLQACRVETVKKDVYERTQT
jgi:excisionase family DNA binding protein